MTGPPVSVTPSDPAARDPRWLRWLRLHGVNPLDTVVVTVDGDDMLVEQLVRLGSKFAMEKDGTPKTKTSHHRVWWPPPL